MPSVGALVFEALRDLVLQTLCCPPRATSGFAFVVHPRDLRHVYDKYPFLARFPEQVSYWLLRRLWPVTVCRVTGPSDHQGRPLEGWIISCAWTADMLLADRDGARNQVRRAVRLAEARGAGYVGLGALTASLTNRGREIAAGTHALITNGRLFTSKIVADTARDAADAVGLPRTARVAIVGAGGSIGSGTAQLLAAHGFRGFDLIDLGDRRDTVATLAQLLQSRHDGITVRTSTDLSSLRDADVIVTATNRSDSLIRSEHVKSGAIIVDDAYPSDVDPEILEHRPDVLVLLAGVVSAPGVDLPFAIGVHGPAEVYSCIAEVILLAADGARRAPSLASGIILDMAELAKLEELARIYGFRRGSFQNAKRMCTAEDIVRVATAKRA